MKIRKIVLLTALLSFMILTLTSFVLYIVPQGRIADWADWHLCGLTKMIWSNLHTNVGVLFLIMIGIHIYNKWKTILSYLRNKAKRINVFTKDFIVAFTLTFVFITGTYFEIPPFVWIINISESINNSAKIKFGDPPYRNAELSTLKAFTSRMDFDLTTSIEQLKRSGVKFNDENQTILEIARLNKMRPQEIYRVIKPNIDDPK